MFRVLSVMFLLMATVPSAMAAGALVDAGEDFLRAELARLDPPDRIRELVQRDSIRLALGGGFYGMLPTLSEAAGEPPVPDGPEALEAAVRWLLEVRHSNLAGIRALTPEYPLEFTGEAFPQPPAGSGPAGMRLLLDLAPLAGVVEAVEQGDISREMADSLARDPAVQAMLEHRRGLGYVPPPLPTTETYARFLRIASSRDPVIRLWSWLNPWNMFGMADVREHLSAYGRLLEDLEAHRQDLERLVMGRIATYLRHPVPLRVTLDVGVNWGIRSWATRDRLGTNATQFKDDYSLLLRTVTHETFHKVQQRICPAVGTDPGQVPSFADLTASDLPRAADRKLHEILSLIMLEGTATLVGGHSDHWPKDTAVHRGWELLSSCLDSLAAESVPAGVEDLVNEGLRNNGPFYAVGWTLAEAVAATYGPPRIGELLEQGAPAFMIAALTAAASRDEGPPAALVGRLQRRLAAVARNTTPAGQD